MPAFPRTVSAPPVTSGGVTSTTETVVCTLPGITVNADDLFVALFGLVVITVGTGQTSATVKIEVGSAAGGTLVNSTGAIQVTAGNTVDIPVAGRHAPGESAGIQYVTTVTFAGGAGNSTIVLGTLQAIVR